MSQAIEYLLTVNLSEARTELNKLETVLMQNLSLIRRFTGGDENLDKAITTAQRLITTIRTLQTTLALFEATTPIGWLLAISSFVGFAVTSVDTIDYIARG